MRNGQICLSESIVEFDLTRARVRVRANEVRPSHRPNSELSDGVLERLKTLTPQQLRVLEMLRRGMLNKQIAYELKVGETTIKAHASEIFRRLNVSSRTMAAMELTKVDLESIVSDPNEKKARSQSDT
jgi:DNA-binding NarL/FixJ family response regulator